MSASACFVPRVSGGLRHRPDEPALPGALARAWSLPLAGRTRVALVAADGRALLMERDGVTVLGDAPGAEPWPRVALPPGWPGTALAGDFPWVTEDGRLLRWTPEGAVREAGRGVDGALALDDERVLAAPRGAPGRVALLVDGREAWRAAGSLAGACPAGDAVVVADPRAPDGVAALGLADGRVRWRGGAAPYRPASVAGVHGGHLWVACADRTLAGISLDGGRVEHALDTGVAVPAGALDASCALHLCHAFARVVVRLGPPPAVAHRASFAGEGIGRLVDPPLPVSGGRVVVRTARGEALMLGGGEPRAVWRGAGLALGIAAAGGRLYLLEHGDPPVLHCLAEAS